MAKGRKAGSKNRNYPPMRLSEALKVATAIADEASGMEVSRLTLSELLKSTPTSSVLREQVSSSRFYGLTNGGTHAKEFSLTKLGEEATGADEVARSAALKAAVMNIPPYKAFFEQFEGKKLPGPTPLRSKTSSERAREGFAKRFCSEMRLRFAAAS